MATAQALADLTEISSQIESAVAFDREGAVLASTVEDERARTLASAALELLRAAEQRGAEGKELAQLDVALQDGSVFVVRDGERLIAAWLELVQWWQWAFDACAKPGPHTAHHQQLLEMLSRYPTHWQAAPVPERNFTLYRASHDSR
jgi:predicted regulator of Ras-like GTPase activity (Roadblock/LC7/MglB family)